ncbi:ADF3 [Symbiodinium natans]|uniref:ADF3 protein n=1 Tax=Symbiodinium natans TaxID=878477 RepID=A0A812PUV8_9DINO|nr:ADF3 [Symbiodinium natans]
MSGVAVNDECVDLYNQIKMKKDLRYVIFKIENHKEIKVECSGPAGETYKDFVAKLPDDQPRYALVDYDYTSDDGRPQSKLCFFFWSPDDKTTVKDRMVYASSKDALKKKFPGIMKEVQANDSGDLDAKEVNDLMLKK